MCGRVGETEAGVKAAVRRNVDRTEPVRDALKENEI